MTAQAPTERVGDTSRSVVAWLCIAVAVLKGFDLQVVSVIDGSEHPPFPATYDILPIYPT